MGDGETAGGTVPGPAAPPAIEGTAGNEGQALADRPARRRRVSGGRGNKHSVRFTDAEDDVVQAAADVAGLTVPHLIAETVLAAVTGRGAGRGQQLPVAERRALAAELAGVRALLASIGGNVNQLAAAANSGNLPAAGAVEATMDAVTRMLARLDAAIAPLEGRPGGDRR
ncbi:MobC domain-containing protein [Actinomadura formosensis]|uniref:plasmid mobilization relaxosome protein MobC n=1 Tax=Actinomadura formosensis TaxID=60706 RepID=UPI000834D2F6|nr:plasmid mobilization relaxosome protein MobC [Actinomadura formosensis]